MNNDPNVTLADARREKERHDAERRKLWACVYLSRPGQGAADFIAAVSAIRALRELDERFPT